MTKLLMIVAALALSSTAYTQKIRYYAPNGSSIGTSSTHGNSTDFYNARGNRTTTESRDSQGNTTVYDPRGNVVGKSSTPPR